VKVEVLVKTPLEIRQVYIGSVTTILVPGLLAIVHEVSADANPLPDTATTVPAGPELGVSDTTGEVL
jgi:hypothetical protein